jgi:hypothetical protein
VRKGIKGVNIAYEQLITPLFLNFIIAHFLQTLYDTLNELELIVFRLEIFFNTFLKNKVTKITLNNFAQARRAAEFFDNLVLKFKWSTIYAGLY